MADIIGLNERRATQTGDCRDWTPLEALKAAIRDIESGEISAPTMLYIAMKCPASDSEDGNVVWTSYMAGGTVVELLGLLAKHQFDTAASWQR